MKNKNQLFFGAGNGKLGKEIATFSLPAGYTCMGADKCLAFANRETGKITNGKNQEFRCFAASLEAIFKGARDAGWDNFEKLKNLELPEMVKLINDSLPNQNIIRVHVRGDFFSKIYFEAWRQIAENNPNKIFYAYTKSLPFWIEKLKAIPENFKLNASRGGKFDDMIDNYNLKSAEVVFSEEEAIEKNLKIDHDDSHAYASDKSFALLLHGSQTSGTKAGEALKKIKKSIKEKILVNL